MNTIKHALLASASLMAVGGFAATASAQTAPATSDAATDNADDIVVTGVRAALRSAQAIKQNSDQIVDSVSAQDIGKLPDVNTTEALQRITGVQIQRRYGEGATDFDHRTQPAITVRGLTQVQNFLDGRASIRRRAVARSTSKGFRPNCSRASTFTRTRRRTSSKAASAARSTCAPAGRSIRRARSSA